MPTCPRLETQRLASACGEDKTNTLHAATTANKSRFRFICHPRIVFDQHAAYPPSIGSRLPRSMCTATFNGDSVLHPRGEPMAQNSKRQAYSVRFSIVPCDGRSSKT